MDRTADLLGPTPYPGQEPEQQDLDQQQTSTDLPPLPEPEVDPRHHQYRFVFINGELHLAPVDKATPEQLVHTAAVDPDEYVGPMAFGLVDVDGGQAHWAIQASTVSELSLFDVAAVHCAEVGWNFASFGDVGTRRSGVERIWWRVAGENVEIARGPIKGGQLMIVGQGIARVAGHHPGLEEWASDNNLKLAEVPGGGNMLDHMRHREDLEMFDRQDPNWEPEGDNPDFEPVGPFACEECGAHPATFAEYKLHMKEHEGMPGGEIEDGHFPQLQDFDSPIPHNKDQYPEMAWNGVQAKVMELPDALQCRRIPEFELYSKLFGFEGPGRRVFGAFQDGGLVGYAIVREVPDAFWRSGELMMVQSGIRGRGIGDALMRAVKRRYDHFYSHADTPQGEALMRRHGMVNVNRQRWHYAAGGEPKDMIEAPVPWILDLRQDKLELGYPGTTTHDIPGQFLPGGIVEGYYEPGGKLIVQTTTSWAFSIRHLTDLWYATAPQMRITSIEQMEQDGSTSKLAAEGQDVGSYIRTITAADPAAHAAWKALSAAGGRVYTVGGAVRDALLGRESNDVDLLVGGLSPAEVHYALTRLPGSVNETGKRFGVFRYKLPGAGSRDVEVALPRTDQYDSGRRGEGKITVDPDLPVEKDLERRDFTANSMAVDLDSGELVDPYGGAHDISRGVLRTTHPNSFREDPTRLVRALTAHGRFGLVPDERTRHEMEAHGHLLRGESPDALNKTLDKLFKSENPAGAIRLGQDTGINQHLFPEVAQHWDYDQNNAHHSYPLGEHLLHVLDNVSRISSDPDVRMAALYHDVGKPASAWTDPATGESHYYHNRDLGMGQDHELVGAQMAADRMKALNYPTARIIRVRSLIEHHMFPPFSTPKGARKFLQRVGPHADDLLNLREADQTGKGQTPEEMAARTSADQMRQLVENARAAEAPTNLSTLNVNGTDLVNMGLKPGPAIGQILNQLMEWVVDDPQMNDRNELLGLAQQLVAQQPPEAFARA